MENDSALGAARRRAAARATALQHELVPPLPLHKVRRPSSPPARTRTRLGTAPSEADERAAVAADLEAAKSGAADGAWALATWAPAGFADAVGGF